ncbi:transcriptional regulator [Rhizobium sp. AC44/96]|uniref:transcriptional repressor TraM n=1 Tax=unclassified Rhizobium TaxID=2613769 RepID=UPI00080FA396|nr:MULTISPECIES: transcriptional repressor TraM [unclassified Rhizobium]MDM9620454.1 transcriptional repressor TraM [Rhizobium sp. S96]OCJ09060.1 transcriptional regulator [Rhizobium sp. AC44/96]
MIKTDHTDLRDLTLRPVAGLLKGVPEDVVEQLTVTAIKRHRDLVSKADTLFHKLPPDIKAGNEPTGLDHVEYLDAAIEMHSQMSALTTLLDILGRTPKV